MRTEQDKKDFLQEIQDKRNNYQRLGTPYDDAEERLTPKPESDEPTEKPESRE